MQRRTALGVVHRLAGEQGVALRGQLAGLGYSQQQIDAGLQLYKPVGCPECSGGYKGRVGLYEILMLSADMKQLVSDNAEIARIRDLAYREGMKPLRISGAMKVASGLTTLAEVFKVAPPSERS